MLYVLCLNKKKKKSNELNPIAFGYVLEEGVIEPLIVDKFNIISDDFPTPCTCGKCARDRSCRCRFLGIPCCEYCYCSGQNICQNPRNTKP